MKVFTTYLTRKPDPQRKSVHSPDDPKLLDTWYQGAKGHGVVFHDELSEGFMSKYPEVEFVRVKNYRFSANDARFEIYAKYLREHKDIKKVFFTDCFDVKINYLPKVANGKLYIQQEPRWQPQNHKNFFRKNWLWVKNAFDRLYNGQIDYGLIGKSVYNAGLIGGTTPQVLKLCDLMVEEFERINVGEKNGNMLVLNKIIYNVMGEDKIVTGYPLHSKFKHYEVDATAAFNHK